MTLSGRRVLVTGAGRGMGSSIARLLASEGASVALTYRESASGAARVADEICGSGGSASIFRADLTDSGDTARLLGEVADALGGLDTLVNNASGFGPLRALGEYDWGEIAAEYEAVVRPVVETTRAALPFLRDSASGGAQARIVNLSATLLQRPAAGQGAHAMAKAAVLSYTRSLARELGPENILVNAVSPGMTRTEFTEALPESARVAVAGRTPLRRLASEGDVARAVLFFCSDWAGFITGANLAPDGGLAVL